MNALDKLMESRSEYIHNFKLIMQQCMAVQEEIVPIGEVEFVHLGPASVDICGKGDWRVEDKINGDIAV